MAALWSNGPKEVACLLKESDIFKGSAWQNSEESGQEKHFRAPCSWQEGPAGTWAVRGPEDSWDKAFQ